MYQDPQPPAESPGLRARREELRATQARVGERATRTPGVPVNPADAADLRRASSAVRRQEDEAHRRRVAREVGAQLEKDPTPGYEDLIELQERSDGERVRRANAERIAQEQYEDSLRSRRPRRP